MLQVLQALLALPRMRQVPQALEIQGQRVLLALPRVLRALLAPLEVAAVEQAILALLALLV